MSWYDQGMPAINDPDVLATAELIRRLYDMPGCDMGGPLHAMLDDGNIDDEQINGDYYECADGRTTETYLCVHRMVQVGTAWRHVYDDELYPPQEVADLCRLILASFRRMPEPWRAAAIAWADGTAWEHIEQLAGEPLISGPPHVNDEQVDDLVADLRRWIEQGETSGPKTCVPIPCPPFRNTTLHGAVSGIIHPGPGTRFAPDAVITGPFDSYSVNEDGSATLHGLHGLHTVQGIEQLPDVPEWQREAYSHIGAVGRDLLVGGESRVRYEQDAETPGLRVTRLDEHGQPIGEPVMVSGWADVGILVDETDPERPKPQIRWVEQTINIPFESVDPELWHLLHGGDQLQVSVADVQDEPPQVEMPKTWAETAKWAMPHMVEVDPAALPLFVEMPEGVDMDDMSAAIALCRQAGLLDTPHGFVLLPPGIGMGGDTP